MFRRFATSTTNARRQSQQRTESGRALGFARREAKQLSASRAFHVTRLGSTKNQKAIHASRTEKQSNQFDDDSRSKARTGAEALGQNGEGAFRKKFFREKCGAPVISRQKSGIQRLLRAGGEVRYTGLAVGCRPATNLEARTPRGSFRRHGSGAARPPGRAAPLTNRGTHLTSRFTSRS